MAGGFASFMTGFGQGYLNARDKEYERERQRKRDEWDEKVRSRQQKQWDDDDATNAAVADAFKPRTTMQGTAVTDATGTSNLYKDPMQAHAAAEEARIEAEMRGQNPAGVMTNKATGVVAEGAKTGHKIAAGDVDLDQENSREAGMSRASQALMQRGKVKDALTMENLSMDNQAKRLGLDVEQLKFADQMFNRKLMETIQSSPDFWTGAASILNNTQLGGLQGVEVQAVLSGDGNTVTMMGTKEGKPVELAKFPANERGQQEFMQRIMKADPVTKIQFLKEAADRQDASARDERDFGVKLAELEIKALTAKSQAELRAAQAEAATLRAQLAQAGNGSGQPPGMNWEDRRKVLSDTAGLLPDPKNAASPEEAIQIQQSNAQTLAMADSIFSMNAGFGTALTAPQIRQAMTMAQDPQNIKTKTDANTGQTYRVVAVNGVPVIVGVAAGQKQASESTPAPAPQANTSSGAAGTRAPAPAPYTPPPDSPAARAQATRQTSATQGMEQQAQAKTEAQTAAQGALQANDPAAAAQVQRLPGFRYLSQEEKAAIFKLVNSAR